MTTPTNFGDHLWVTLTAVPLGSLTKREMELAVVRAAIDASRVEATPAAVATEFRITLARAQSYLTDLALRQDPLENNPAMQRLLGLLLTAEVSKDGNYLTFAVQDSSLRIWLERKMASLELLHGESLRKDVVKLTPNGLARLFDVAGVRSPYEALTALPKDLNDQSWLRDAKKAWRKGMTWSRALDVLGQATSSMEALPGLVPAILQTIAQQP